jgi:hypothetical protein
MTKILANERPNFWRMKDQIFGPMRFTKILANERPKFWPDEIC